MGLGGLAPSIARVYLFSILKYNEIRDDAIDGFPGVGSLDFFEFGGARQGTETLLEELACILHAFTTLPILVSTLA